MMPNKIYHTRLLLLLFLSIAFPVLGFAQEETVLTESIYKQMVLENNHKILAEQASVDAAQKQIDVNRKDFYPSLDFVGRNLYVDENTTPEGFPTIRSNFYSLGLNLSQNIYSGGMVRKNKKLAEIYAEKSLAGKEITENDILYLAATTYWTAVSAVEELQIWKDYRERFEDFYQTIADRVEEAIVSKNELLTTRVQLNEIDLKILQSEKTAEVARLNLKKLAMMQVGQPVSLLDSIVISEVLPDTTDILEEALQQRPEIRFLQQEVQAAEQKRKMAGAKYAPNIGVSLGGNYSNGLVEKPDQDFNYSVLATASLPIVRWGKMRSEKAVQEFYTQAAREELRNQEVNVEFDIAEAYFNLQQGLKQVKLAEAAEVEAREKLVIYMDRYDEGLASIVEVTEAQTFLQNAIVLQYIYRINYQFSLLEYDKALGILNNVN